MADIDSSGERLIVTLCCSRSLLPEVPLAPCSPRRLCIKYDCHVLAHHDRDISFIVRSRSDMDQPALSKSPAHFLSADGFLLFFLL
jgi:hypothetical protein